MKETALSRLLAERLERPLQDVVTERRSQGAGWARIASELHTATRVRVSHETLRSWFADALVTTVTVRPAPAPTPEGKAS